MRTKQEVTERIIEQGILPLFFHKGEEISAGIARTLYKAGIRVIEYTNRGETALANFKVLKQLQALEMPDLLLGIGTIKTAKQATDFAEAGADFIVAPIVNPEVAATAAKQELLWIPGCMTPTEIHTALHFGASIVKIFPASILGPEFISSVREIFANQLFIPTGGVELEQQNITAWFKAGVCAVGMGSKLITSAIIEERDYEKLYINTLNALKLVKASR